MKSASNIKNVAEALAVSKTTLNTKAPPSPYLLVRKSASQMHVAVLRISKEAKLSNKIQFSHSILEPNLIYAESKVISFLMVMLSLLKGVTNYNILLSAGVQFKVNLNSVQSKMFAHQDLITRLPVMIYSRNIFQLVSHKKLVKIHDKTLLSLFSTLFSRRT